MITLKVQVTEKQKKAIVKAAKMNKVSQAEVIRTIVTTALAVK